FYRIINPEEIQHEKTLGGGLEKFAYHVEVVGGMIPFCNSWALNSTDIKLLESLNKEIADLKKQIQALTILAEDRKAKLSQEQQALIKLAKQKLTNKKEAAELLNQLTQN
ncbi:10318_t:CDS:2, partial [Scutellospora calospora]